MAETSEAKRLRIENYEGYTEVWQGPYYRAAFLETDGDSNDHESDARRFVASERMEAERDELKRCVNDAFVALLDGEREEALRILLPKADTLTTEEFLAELEAE